MDVVFSTRSSPRGASTCCASRRARRRLRGGLGRRIASRTHLVKGAAQCVRSRVLFLAGDAVVSPRPDELGGRFGVYSRVSVLPTSWGWQPVLSIQPFLLAQLQYYG